MSKSEKEEIINNALEAGPTIPFANFSKLFKTWLEVLTTIHDIQRDEIFNSYVHQIVISPEKLIKFNLDGILEIYLSLDKSKKEILSRSIVGIISQLDENRKKRLLLLIPENVKAQLGI